MSSIETMIYDQKDKKVMRVSDPASLIRQDSARYTLTLPKVVLSDGSVRYHADAEINSTINGLVRFLGAMFKRLGVDDTGLETNILYAGDPIDTCLLIIGQNYDSLVALGDGVVRQLEAFMDKLSTQDSLQQESFETREGYDIVGLTEQVLNANENVVLSRGERFGAIVEKTLREQSVTKIEQLSEVADKTFSEVIEETRHSLEQGRESKMTLLQTLVQEPDQAAVEEDIRTLRAEILAIEQNIEYCQVFLEKEADYDTFEGISKELIGQVQDEVAGKQVVIQGIDLAANKLQAITSLTSQFIERRRKRINTEKKLVGDGEDRGLRGRAINRRTRMLSQSTTDEGIPMLNMLTSQKLGQYIQRKAAEMGFTITQDSLVDMVYSFWVQEEGDEYAKQLKGDAALLSHQLDILKDVDSRLDIDSAGIELFITYCYSTSEEDEYKDLKGRVIVAIVDALNWKLSIDIRSDFDALGASVVENIDLEDYVQADMDIQQEQMVNKLSSVVSMILRYMQVEPTNAERFVEEHFQSISDILLAYFEITIYANDEHLNESAIIRDLIDSKFFNKPMSLQVIRCLRWCYPDREVEIAPTTGDFDTKGPQGEPVKRHEWVEQEKLMIFRRNVIDPIKHHGFNVGRVSLLCTGDYELTSPGGYDFDASAPQCVDARAYVESVRESVLKNWDTFTDLIDEGINVEVISFKQLISQRFGSDRFAELLAYVEQQYDELFTDPEANFVGYAGQSLEMVIDKEHGHRQPFIAGWNRDRSRTFTRHKITWELAMGVMVAMCFDGPRIMTVSGNRYSGMTFSKAHQVHEIARSLGIVLMGSVNDGTQSAHFAAKTKVVGQED